MAMKISRGSKMNSAARRRNQNIRILRPGLSRDGASPKPILLRDKIRLLEQLIGELLPGLASLIEERVPDIEQGLDFYEEVSRFEIAMIKKALIVVGGNQAKAARLLNLNATTLNSKLKQYHLKTACVAVLTDPDID
jgi:transcriptional regulator with GAF, ATPase, and Fis domain